MGSKTVPEYPLEYPEFRLSPNFEPFCVGFEIPFCDAKLLSSTRPIGKLPRNPFTRPSTGNKL